MIWDDWAAGERDRINEAGQWRSPRELDAAGPVGRLATGGEVVSFASNDYLGLTQHAEVVQAAHDALDRWGAGSGAARLIVGSRPVHSELERELASWKAQEAAVLFPTGFAANLGVLSALGGAGVRICSDELNHASIIDGCRLSRSDVAIYRHNDLDHLATLLKESDRAIVVSDTVFSMDGDLAHVDDLADLCRERGALLVLDEAHAVLSPEPALDGVTLLRVGTLSKTLGSLGGFVAGPASLVELLVNRSRPYIFTTASTPADTAAALAGLRVLRSAEGETLKGRLRSHVERICPGHPSPILPIVIGDERAALDAARSLEDAGLLVPAIRPPTVAPGTSRLRIAFSAAHTEAQVDRLGAALDSIRLSDAIGGGLGPT